MRSMKRRSRSLLASFLFALTTPACLAGPTDKQLVDTTATPLAPWGYYVAPSAAVTVEAFNYGTGHYDVVGNATTGSSPMSYGPPSNPVNLYSWDAGSVVLGSPYWKASSYGPAARVRGSAQGHTFVSLRADWTDNIDFNKPIGDFLSKSKSPDTPDALVYACPSPHDGKARYSIQELPPCARNMIVDAILSQVSRHPPTDGSPNVSIDRNYTITYGAAASFFNDIRGYLHDMEKAVSSVLPNHPWMPSGHLPYWDGSAPMPAELVHAIKPSPESCESGSQVAPCANGWKTTPFAHPAYSAPVPAGLQGPALCANATLDDLHMVVHSWHDAAHGGIGGVFAMRDSPATAIFWAWHTFIDQVHEKWLACPHP